MKKILFLIHDLGQGGAEKVLVNLVNQLDRTKFDIYVTALFGGGVNEQFLAPDIHFRTVFPRNIPGNSRWMKLFTPSQLHCLIVREPYDIEVAYLEGPSARVISGCHNSDAKLLSWIHSTTTEKSISKSFRSGAEATKCYRSFDRIVCVSEGVKRSFSEISGIQDHCVVLHNTMDSSGILTMAGKSNLAFSMDGGVRLVSVGSLKNGKGFERLLRIMKRLRDESYPVNLYILGKGPLRSPLEEYVAQSGLEGAVTFLGYQTNPYKYVARCDLFVCASFAEGFSTAAMEALILGVPVCTVEVSGMKEMLGEHNEYGIVTENSEEALYEGIKSLLDDPSLLAHYREKAEERGKMYRSEESVRAVEDLLLSF